MLLSCIDEWSVAALHSISSDLDAELRTIALLAGEIDAIGLLPGWHSCAADNARTRMQSAKAALLDDGAVLRTVEALAVETARQLTEIKDALGDLRAEVAAYGGDLQLAETAEVTVVSASDDTGRLHAVAHRLGEKAKALIAKAEALDADCGEVLGSLVGDGEGVHVQADWPFLRMAGGLTVYGTDGNDVITVTQDRSTGDVRVTFKSDSDTYSATLAAAEVDGLTIETRCGDDEIIIEPGITYTPDEPSQAHLMTTLGFKVEAGSGNDRIRGGSGRDYLNGSAGHDVIEGRQGDDVIYGGDGRDYVNGGHGDNYMDGGMGDDVIYGDRGNDLLHGGQGNDVLVSGLGDDVVVTGAGTDKVFNLGGVDTVMAQYDEAAHRGEDFVFPVASGNGGYDIRDTTLVEIPDNIDIVDRNYAADGPERVPNFGERVWADLELYRSTGAGQDMLESIGRSGDTVEIREEQYPNSHAYGPGAHIPGPDDQLGPDHLEFVPDDHAVITYNPNMTESFPVLDPSDDQPVGQLTFTPATSLFHEFAHVYDYLHGTLDARPYSGTDRVDRFTPIDPTTLEPVPVLNSERIAVGLGVIDHDNDPATPELRTPDHPFLLTENGLRTELGLAPREHYGTGR